MGPAISITLLAALAAAALHTSPVAAQSRPTTSPASAPAAGKWYYYSSFATASMLAATDRYLWFGHCGLFYYDLKTRKAHAITPMDGVCVDRWEMSCVSPAPDGRFVFPNGLSDYAVWTAGKGLTPVSPEPRQGWYEWIGFDSQNRLWLRKKLELTKDGEWFMYDVDNAAWQGPYATPQPSELPPAIGTQNGLRCDKVWTPLRYNTFTITLENGRKLPPLKLEIYRSDKPYRDANGDIWLENWRWDGRDWQCITPPDLFPFADVGSSDAPLGVHWPALDGRRCELDDKTMTWRSAFPGGDADICVYDPDTKTGFRQKEKRGRRLLEEVKREGMAWKALREVDVSDYTGKPGVRDKNGDWWWVSYDEHGNGLVLRLTAAGLKAYHPDWPGCGVAPRQLVLSPKGQLWLYDWLYWQRFDYGKDKFIPPPVETTHPWLNAQGALSVPVLDPSDCPLDEFAFTFGPWKLSRIGARGRAGQVYIKTGQTWRPFTLPGADMSAGYDRCFSGTDRMIHGRRMLLRWEGENSGIYEYDLDTGCWEYLSEAGYAGYDDRGRVIIVAGYGVLVYVRGTDNVATQPALGPELERRFKQLVQQLDDNSWQQREAATEHLAEMGKAVVPLIEAELKAPRQSAEVASRLSRALKKIVPPPPRHPVPLLRKMHPLLTTHPAS